MGTYRPEGLKSGGTETLVEEKPAGSARPPKGAALGVKGWLRWTWRQLTSMRVALMLLLLLAAVALPGAFFPQRSSDPNAVVRYYQDNPDTAPVLDDLHLFDVFSSPWFSAVYLLLFISLIGCIIPRTFSHLKNLRAAPTRVPRRFARFPVRTELHTRMRPDQVAEALSGTLGRRYRKEWGTESVTTTAGRERTIRTVSAERGTGRETGNLVFHLALVGLLVVTAWGQLVHYRGQIVIIEDRTFVNSPVDYDSFDTGAWFDAEAMEPFRIRMNDFSSVFTEDAQPRDFAADVSLLTPDGSSRDEEIRLNHPLETNSTRVYLSGNGYAPDVTVTDASGEVAFSGPVIFLPAENDLGYTSNGAIMVPDTAQGLDQLGFSGSLLPTAAYATDGTPVTSSYPELLNPVLLLNLYTGDLGLDDGVPQNLYTLDTAGLTPVADPEDPAEAARITLQPGETVELPDGLGTITLNDIPRFAALDVRYDPSVLWMGLFAGIAIAGLTGSLFLPRRRLWARIIPGPGGTTVVTAAALARGDDPGLRRELDRVLAPISQDEPAAEQTKERS
ncbi:MAG TPA: cytochrome c biogenesis protein ResB [Candidatus Ruania gallistercoris]|uniref:Cytochrome c biogenesis protein ResB n=1 Tax=Candidatus Ruania gallistercoris TaxID=2838746 RepID=A0A9D2EGQ4_9MICO|nr:cytochrome c biogenesis protein ResB [Candidatus Ruania gallistercoris]